MKNKSEIGYNELFYTMPIKNNENNNEIYIKTYSSNLYLGSDENGLLFIGNVRKHYQIWIIEMYVNIVICKTMYCNQIGS